MIRGTNYEQDSRFADKTKRMLEKSVWPDEYDQRVNLNKVDMELVKLWIEKKVKELLGYEDDIASNTAISLLQKDMEALNGPDPRKIHIALSGLLGQKNSKFMIDLWRLLVEAQTAPNGIPASLVESKKKQEMERREELKELEAKRNKLGSKINRSYLDRMVRATNSYNQNKGLRSRSRERSTGRERRNQQRRRSPEQRVKKERRMSVQRQERQQRRRSPERRRSPQRRRQSPQRRHQSPQRRRQSPESPRYRKTRRYSSSDSSDVEASSSSSSSSN